MFLNTNSHAYDITCSNTSYKCWHPAPPLHTLLQLHQHQYCPICTNTAQCEQENSVTVTGWEMFLSHDVGYWAEGTQEHVCSVHTFSNSLAAIMLFQYWATRGNLKMVEQAKPAPVLKVKKFCLFIWRENESGWFMHYYIEASPVLKSMEVLYSMLLRNKIGCKKSEGWNLFQMERKVQVIVTPDVNIWSVGVCVTLFLAITVMD